MFSATVKDCFVKAIQQNFDSLKMKLEISHEGSKRIKEFWYAYRNICSENVNGMLLKYKR